MVKVKSIPSSFAAADTFLGGKDSRKIHAKRSTEIVRLSQDKIALYYHSTPVVTWYRDGVTQLRAGGHRSVTTKRRMNDAIQGAYVWQRQYEWFVTIGKRTPVPFFDGMIV